MAKVYERSAEGAVDFNMTPMIDVTFQLILFFILAGQVASEALAKMQVPRPYESQALEEKEVTVPKVIVNVVSKGAADKEVDPFIAGKVQWYVVDGNKIRPGNYDELVRVIEDRLKTVPRSREKSFFVEVRADRRVQFQGVEPVLSAAVDAGVEKMNITAIRNLGG